MKGLDSLPSWAILTVILLVTSSLNEVVSNATTASILLPVLKDISIQLGLKPLYLMLPVVLSCNYTFMLPASCPPNAIVYKVSLCHPCKSRLLSILFQFCQASGMKIYHMVLTGFGVKMITLVLSLVAANTYGGPLLGMDQFPDWANSSVNAFIA